MDKLQALLSRAKAAAAAAQSAQQSARASVSAREISEDYAARLQDRSTSRRALAAPDLDAMRFRWYFTKIENTIPIDQLRAWIDGKIKKEEEAHHP